MRKDKILVFAFLSIASFVFAQKVVETSGVAITVQDMDLEVTFFKQALHFQVTNDTLINSTETRALYNLPKNAPALRVVTLQLGDESIRLLDFDPQKGVAANELEFNQQTRSNDRWFQHIAIVVSDMDSAYQHLLAFPITHVSTAPQTLPNYLPNAAGIKAFYFRDPEGHNLELIGFPANKGAAKWQKKDKKGLFLGIDHTAIGISNTQTSMAFYKDLLGFRVAGHSENYGTEQEHLNQVFGARLDINGLQASQGIGVEFLRYIAPPGGCSYPLNSHPSNLWHYQTELKVDEIAPMVARLVQAGYPIISTSNPKTASQFLLRDPDGHAVLLVEQPNQ